jgi:hypothetical protein
MSKRAMVVAALAVLAVYALFGALLYTILTLG